MNFYRTNARNYLEILKRIRCDYCSKINFFPRRYLCQKSHYSHNNLYKKYSIRNNSKQKKQLFSFILGCWQKILFKWNLEIIKTEREWERIFYWSVPQWSVYSNKYIIRLLFFLFTYTRTHIQQIFRLNEKKKEENFIARIS